MHVKSLWLIEGFDGSERSFMETLPARTSAKEVRLVLQRLAARHLTPAEVVNASRRKLACYERNPLTVRAVDSGRDEFVIGVDPSYTARLCGHFEYVRATRQEYDAFLQAEFGSR